MRELIPLCVQLLSFSITSVRIAYVVIYTDIFFLLLHKYSTVWTYNKLLIHSVRYHLVCFQCFIIMITKAKVFQLCFFKAVSTPLGSLHFYSEYLKNIVNFHKSLLGL